MLNEENKQQITNPIETEDGTIIVLNPGEEEDVYEREILERRSARGRVRWFSRSLGYGFIQEDGNSAELFVHQTAIQVPGVKNLRTGQRVLFELCKTTKADNVVLNVLPIMEKPEALARYRLKKLAENASE